MAKEPEWTAVRVKLSDLAPWDENPVILTQAAAKKLIKSTKALGRLQSIAIGPRDESGKFPLYDGHQRANVWGAAYGMELEVNALMSDRPLDDDERHAVPIMTRAAVGALNWEKSWLTQWPDQVKAWGYDEDTLHWLNNDANNLRQMINADAPPVDPMAEWEGMPEFEQEDKTAWKSITVHFDSPDNLNNFAELVEQTLTEKTKSIWYPKKEREDLLALVAHEQS